MRTVLQAFSLIKRIFYSTLIRFITHFNRLWAQNTWIKDTMAGKSSNKIENLNNQNYQTWKFKMELLLIKEDLWETVTKDIPDPVTAVWQTKHTKNNAIIILHIT